MKSASPSAADLAHSVACTGDVDHATREPVLLLGAIGVTTARNYGYNYEKAFTAARVPYCTSDEPGALASNVDDIQLRGELTSATTFSGVDYTEIYTAQPIEIAAAHTPTAMGRRSPYTVARHGSPTSPRVRTSARSTRPTTLGARDVVTRSRRTRWVIDALIATTARPPRHGSPRPSCTQPLMPGIDPVTYPTDSGGIDVVALEEAFTTYAALTAEPPLACYVRPPRARRGLAGRLGSRAINALMRTYDPATPSTLQLVAPQSRARVHADAADRSARCWSVIGRRDARGGATHRGVPSSTHDRAGRSALRLPSQLR